MKKNIRLILALACALGACHAHQSAAREAATGPTGENARACARTDAAVTPSAVHAGPLITPEGYGGLKIGMKQADVPAKMAGVYDAVRLEKDEIMGEYPDMLIFSLKGKQVASATLSDERTICSLEVTRTGARTADGRLTVGMPMGEAVKSGTYYLVVNEGGWFIDNRTPNARYSIINHNPEGDDGFTPAFARTAQAAYERGVEQEIRLTEKHFRKDAKLWGIQI